MGTESYRKAVEIVEAHKERYHSSGPKSEDLISLAEQALGRRVCGLYREFLKTYGAARFGGQQIYGVINADFAKSRTPDAIWFTLTERQEVGLPEDLLIIYSLGDGEVFCLDLSECEAGKEPKVVAYTPGYTSPGQKLEVIASDFGDFFLHLAESALEFWGSLERDSRDDADSGRL